MLNPRLVQAIALVACIALLFGSSRLIAPINERRADMNMTGITADDPVESAPPEYAFAIQALGAFRGLLTNIMFIRATELKEKGRYYDAMQLASWICKLQPRFPSVWEFQSWNMAWNISVTTHTPEERWNWVYNGVKLVRDEGLKYNPRAVNLYKQVAWIFVNKMSETVDEHHLTYKRNWAWRMHLVLGAPPDPLRTEREKIQPADLILEGSDPFVEALKVGGKPSLDADEIRRRERELEAERRRAERSSGLPQDQQPEGDGEEKTPYEVHKAACVARIQEIQDAPRTLEDLYARSPATRDMVAKLRAMGIPISDDKLSEDDYWSDNPQSPALSMSFFMRYRKLTDPESVLAKISKEEKVDPDQPNLERFDQIIGARDFDPDGLALLSYLQRKVLSEVYKLDPAHMVHIMKKFGPMDWRVVDAHSLYWVTQSIIAGKETINEFGNDKTNTTRLLFFSLRNLHLRNKLIFEPNPDAIHLSYINLTRDINFIEPMHQAFIEYGPLLAGEYSQGPGASETFRVGHTSFLTESIRSLYLAGREEEAEHYFEYLRTTYGLNAQGRLNLAFAKPLREFVRDSYISGIGGPRETQLAINAWLDLAFGQLSLGNYKEYDNLTKMAHELHKNYHESSPLMSQSKKLPPFYELQIDALIFFMARPALSPIDTIHKTKLWWATPIFMKRATYDRLIDLFREECDKWEFKLAEAFPEPPGMEAFRKELESRGLKEEEKSFETPVQVP